jgi:hypothetical protein
MSNEQKKFANKTGWTGPLFPREISPLHSAYAKLSPSCSGLFLDQVGKSIDEYSGIERAETNDEYSWFWSLNFQTRCGTTVAVHFPWAQDWKKCDGTITDRSIAVYTRDSAINAETSRILQQLTEALKKEICLRISSRNVIRATILEEIFGIQNIPA